MMDEAAWAPGGDWRDEDWDAADAENSDPDAEEPDAGAGPAPGRPAVADAALDTLRSRPWPRRP